MKYPHSVHWFLVVICLWCRWAIAVTPPFEEGKQYQRIEANVLKNPLIQDLITEGKGKIQIIEFFSYGCDWCYKLDPQIEQWRLKQPAIAAFQRIPVEFQPSWRTLTKTYYTALNLNVLDKIHMPLFEAIQTNKIQDSSEATLLKFFVEKGVKKADFNQVFHSPEVNTKQQWANAITRAYQIAAVPAIIVQGQSGAFLTNVKLAESEENLFKILDYLISMERNALKGQDSPKKAQ